MSPLKVVIVVLNYNRLSDTSECLRSLMQSTYPEVEIVLVDNASRDGSGVALSRLFPTVKVLLAESNLGYAGGMNLGIKHAVSRHAEYVVLLNSDTIPEKNFVGALVQAMENHRNAGAVAGAIYCYPNIEDVWPSAGALSKLRSGGFVDRGLAKKIGATVQSVTFLSGCALALRISVLMDIGPFDERFFMYLEDTELCARLLDKGYKLLFVPDAKIYHRVGIEQAQAYQLYFNARNRFLFNEIATKGIFRYSGLVYLWLVYAIKFAAWLVIAPSWIRWTCAGIHDYYARRFYSGRAFEIH